MDESGDPGHPIPYGTSTTRYFVQTALIIDPVHINYIDRTVPEIIQKYVELPESGFNGTKFHRTSLISKSGPYKKIGELRWEYDQEIFDLIREIRPVIYSVAIDKNRHYVKYITPADPFVFSNELLFVRINKYLNRVGKQGEIRLDAGGFETRGNRIVQINKQIAHLRQNGVEGYFGGRGVLPDSNLSNIQGIAMPMQEQDCWAILLTDFCAHAIWSYYEKGIDYRYLDPISSLFDRDGGKLYGDKVWP